MSKLKIAELFYSIQGVGKTFKECGIIKLKRL
jgi:hypothetical protein